MGFLGIDRGLRDHWIYQDSEYLKVWLEMLFLARFAQEPHTELVDGEIVVVNYSEFIFGRIKWSDRLKVSEQRLRTLLKKLKTEGMIEVVSEHRKCTLYRIKNYAKFNQQSNQQTDQSQQGIEAYDNQQSNQPSTSSQPAANQQLTTKEQGKQRNKDNKVNKEDQKIKYAEYVRLSPDEYEKLIAEYGEEMTKECIDILNTYKGSTGKNYKSDYMTMTPKAWVTQRYKENQAKNVRQFQVLKGGNADAKHGTGHSGYTDEQLNSFSF